MFRFVPTLPHIVPLNDCHWNEFVPVPPVTEAVNEVVPPSHIVSAYWTATPINLISGFIFSGLLGWWLGKTVEKTGLLRTTRKK